MPDRIIRDELLTSERYWSVSMQAQQCYIHLLLVVDDAARFSGKNFTLRAACFPGRPIEAGEMERMLTELTDADLVRPYMVEGQRYIFMPRFRNRRRYVGTSKYPSPPNEINDLPVHKSSLSHPQVIPKSPPSQEGLGLERGRSGVGEIPKTTRKRSQAAPAGITTEVLVADGLPESLAAEYMAHRKRKRAVLTDRAWGDIKAEARKAGWKIEDAIAKALNRGWTGVEAAWLEKAAGPENTTAETAYQRSVRERVEEMAPSVARKAPGAIKPETIDAATRFLD